MSEASPESASASQPRIRRTPDPGKILAIASALLADRPRGRSFEPSVLVALQGSGHAPAARHHALATEAAGILHDRCAEQTAPIDRVARTLARNGDDAHGGGLA